MTPDPVRPDWPALGPVVVCGALVVYVLAVPLGLDPVASASAAAQGWALNTWATGAADPAGAPLAVLWIRLFGYLPLGDAAARANLASVVAGAWALGWLARLATEVLQDLRPPPTARRGPRDVAHEPVAAALGALAAGMSLGVCRVVTCAGASALTLVLVAGVWRLMLRVARDAGQGRDGAWLALGAGLAVGVDPVATPLLWPPALLLWTWALRRGQRWTLVAPLMFVVGAAILLVPVAGSSAPAPFTDLLGRLFLHDARASLQPLSWPALAHVFREASEQLGAIALLIGVVGLAALLVRAPFTFALVLASAVIPLLVASASPGTRLRAPDLGAAFPLLLIASALPVAVGAAFLSGKLGPARLPTAFVLALTALISPFLDGGNARWMRDSRLPGRLLERGLAQAPLRARVDPGTPEMDGVFRYAKALGLRPDLTVRFRR